MRSLPSLLIVDAAFENRLFYHNLLSENSLLANYEVLFAQDLKEAFGLIETKKFELILLNLFLPDSTGLEGFDKIYQFAPTSAIIAITENADEELAVSVLQMGAEDYLVRKELTSNNLSRAFNYALAREKVRMHLRAESFTDELTGVYNRRGFMAMAQQNLSLAKKQKTTFHLFLIDVDHLKKINDTFGHLMGDCALCVATACLKSTFRTHDIIGRIGGDEFVVITMNTKENEAADFEAQLYQTVDQINHSQAYPFAFSLSVGYAFFQPQTDPSAIDSIQSLIEKADLQLYENKRASR